MTKRNHQQGALFQCAHLILPWLTPPELAATSSTCKTLRRLSASVTAARSSDAARGLEPLPIPFLNYSADSQPYAYFAYSPTQTPRKPDPTRQNWGPGNPIRTRPDPGWVDPDVEGVGCECEGRCVGMGCPCGGVGVGSGWECGPRCGCGPECGNRVSQRGLRVRVKVVKKDERKGWGLFAARLIPRGEFICEYAGELLTTEEARKRQQKYDKLALCGRFASALLVVREHLPSGKACMRLNIDATLIGNVARFVNHSCDGGNLSTVLVRSSGALIPRLCFFASRDIQEDEELTYSYGEVRVRSTGLKCFCGSSCCFGILPSENT